MKYSYLLQPLCGSQYWPSWQLRLLQPFADGNAITSKHERSATVRFIFICLVFFVTIALKLSKITGFNRIIHFFLYRRRMYWISDLEHLFLHDFIICSAYYYVINYSAHDQTTKITKFWPEYYIRVQLFLL